MHLLRTIVTVILLSASPLAFAAHWVVDFSGSAEDYVIKRGDTELQPERLMVLQPNDLIIVKEASGHIVLVDHANERQNCRADDSPYLVPASAPPPSLLANVRDWAESWWNTRGRQSSKTVAAVTKGGFDPSIAGDYPDGAMLLSGTRDIWVSWHGGIPPFSLQLKTDSGETVTSLENVQTTSATLPATSLSPGNYVLQVAAGGPADVLNLTVVDQDALPDRAVQIMALDAPEEVRLGHLALFLGTQDRWRFEARQIAATQDLQRLAGYLDDFQYSSSAVGER